MITATGGGGGGGIAVKPGEIVDDFQTRDAHKCISIIATVKNITAIFLIKKHTRGIGGTITTTCPGGEGRGLAQVDIICKPQSYSNISGIFMYFRLNIFKK